MPEASQQVVRLRIPEGFRHRRLKELTCILQTETEFNQMVTDKSSSKLSPWPLDEAQLSEGSTYGTIKKVDQNSCLVFIILKCH